MEAKRLCAKCSRVRNAEDFYKRKDGTRLELCKDCVTLHIDNFDPETFTWILKDLDVPYAPWQWNFIRDKAIAKNPNLKGNSVLGKYLSAMKLKQWKSFGWEDSEALQQEHDLKNKITEEQREEQDKYWKEKLENGDISEAQYKTLTSTETQYQEMLTKPAEIPAESNNPYGDGSNFIDESLLVDVGTDLTEEDKIYLAMKWGRLYKPSEWVEMERVYREMEQSFDIQDADTINTLILICKTNLKMNQYLDCSDIEGYQRLSRVYNDLRKSAKFTAAQNKDEKDEYVDSIGELISLCEKEGFIPRYATDIPQDKVDATLKDMNDYVKKLVTQDLGFGQQIENALKKIQIQKEMEESVDQETVELTDNDFEEYYKNIEEQKQLDKEGDN